MADLEEDARRQAAGKKAVVLSPIAIEVVRRIDALFDIERSINGKPAEERRAVRQELSKPLVEALQVYMREQRAKLFRTIARVAEMLGEDEDWLWDVANEMDQEDGLIWVYGLGDDGVMAFTDFGIETLTGLIEIYKADPHLLKRSSDPK